MRKSHRYIRFLLLINVVISSCAQKIEDKKLDSREETLINAWKGNDWNIVELLFFLRNDFDTIPFNDIKQKYHSNILFYSCIDSLTESITGNERKNLVIDYLISYANIKKIENKLFLNEILANNYRVSSLPYYPFNNKIDTVSVRIGINFPDNSKYNPYLILDQKKDTIFYDTYYGQFLLPVKNLSEVSGKVYIYNLLDDNWLPYSFQRTIPK